MAISYRRRFSRPFLGLRPRRLSDETPGYSSSDDKDTLCNKCQSKGSSDSLASIVHLSLDEAFPPSSSAVGRHDDGGGRATSPEERSNSPLSAILNVACRVGQFPQPNMGTGYRIGYLSILILLLVALTNFALEVVYAQIHQLDSPHFYDALSTEVIVPPFRYKSSSEQSATRRPRLGLGTAAIDSVTSALSPILPFTGGVDLRKKEHWHLVDDEDELWWWGGTFSSITARTFAMFGTIATPWGNNGDVSSEKSKSYSSELKDLLAGRDKSSQIASPDVSNAASVTLRDIAKRRNRKVGSASVLATPAPFLSTDIIARLTLGDVSSVFHYAIENNRANFNRKKFFNNLDERMKLVVNTIDEAVTKTRGKGVKPAATQRSEPANESEQQQQRILSSVGFGDFDALQFCAVMRIFAEWRIVRQVPEGYKGYAVGMSLGHKDIVQNVAKIESAVHGYIHDKREYLAVMAKKVEDATCVAADGTERPECKENRDSDDNIQTREAMSELRSPTLRELLQYELDIDLHPTSKLPRLKDNSAAMGILWVRRQLQYQTVTFANIAQVPTVYPNSYEAVSAAYREVYDRFHGWAVQKIFTYSFQAAPEADVITRFMNPHRLKEVMDEARRIVDNEKGESEKTPDEDKKGKTIPPATSEENLVDSEVADEIPWWDKFGNHVASEFEKLSWNLGKMFNRDGNDEGINDLNSASGDSGKDNRRARRRRGDNPESVGLAGEALERYITQEMSADAGRHIGTYQKMAQPILGDLAGLFDEMNMDDPTKV